jgi:hypothetical protein
MYRFCERHEAARVVRQGLTLAEMLRRLETDPLSAREYEEFVRQCRSLDPARRLT